MKAELSQLADQYNGVKNSAKVNIIECGRLLVKAKSQCEHGAWIKWLNDHRVHESEDTAQNIMKVFRTFGKMINTEPVRHLGVKALVTLTRLPKEFKKKEAVEIEPGHTEEMEVIDEAKFKEFMDKEVEVKDSKLPESYKVKVSQLPANKLKKYMPHKEKKAPDTKTQLDKILNRKSRAEMLSEFVEEDKKKGGVAALSPVEIKEYVSSLLLDYEQRVTDLKKWKEELK